MVAFWWIGLVFAGVRYTMSFVFGRTTTCLDERAGPEGSSGGITMLSVGERVRQRRQELRWSQDLLAQKAGISKSFLSDLETGKRSIGADTLLDLGRALEVSLDYLMTGEPGQPPDLQIPHDLAAFATEEGISMRQTLTLLYMQRQIVLNRKEPVRERAAGAGGLAGVLPGRQEVPVTREGAGVPTIEAVRYKADITAGALKVPESRIIAGLLLRRRRAAGWKDAIVTENVLQARSPATAKRLALPDPRPAGDDGAGPLEARAGRHRHRGHPCGPRRGGQAQPAARRLPRSRRAGAVPALRPALASKLWDDYLDGCRERDPDMPQWHESTTATPAVLGLPDARPGRIHREHPQS